MIWFSASCTWTSLPNAVGLLGLPLRMISVCGSIAHDLAWKTRDSLEDPGLGLLHHLPHSLGHEFQCFRHLPHPLAATRCKMLHLLHHALGLIQNLSRHAQKFGVLFPLSLLSLRPWLAGRQRNRHHSFLHCTHAVANLLAQPA